MYGKKWLPRVPCKDVASPFHVASKRGKFVALGRVLAWMSAIRTLYKTSYTVWITYPHPTRRTSYIIMASARAAKSTQVRPLHFPIVPLLPIPPFDDILPDDPSVGETMDGPSQTLSDYIQNSRHLEATSSMTISRFYQHVLSRRASASAVDKICFLGMYQEVRFTIKHTYILLGVQPSHGQLFFLRLDRAAGQDRNLWLRLRSVSSKFPPNDRPYVVQ
ncbi:hypothetical protein BS47DRAFT_84908 [Hydnum rufescens UP504]|uniref:Uncharacterized protein n=1 Tax=Hydnum rufescens UP504 TaxID=1448309 RepID=A0A9P6B7M8_9AGAM|nr:hypothetical protein BS47DRAFT_84908 [Hydnum rufescens UP504]